MAKRLFDIVFALAVLVAASPFLAVAALGVKLASPGPALYRADRIGRGGAPFEMYKFRSMHVRTEQGSAITAPGDQRIFQFGAFLRKTKIDELPQFFNVLTGDMSIVGPRPEDPRIVETYYREWMRETLSVAPGITSPGALYHYTHGDQYLDPDDPEGAYVNRFMAPKLALERVYVAHASFGYDLALVWRTVSVIVQLVLGRRAFPDPPEMAEARGLLDREASA